MKSSRSISLIGYHVSLAIYHLLSYADLLSIRYYYYYYYYKKAPRILIEQNKLKQNNSNLFIFFNPIFTFVKTNKIA